MFSLDGERAGPLANMPWVQNFWGERCWWRASASCCQRWCDVMSVTPENSAQECPWKQKRKVRWWRVEFLLSICALAWAAWQECQRPAWAEKIVLRARGSHASDFFSKRRKKCMQDLTSAPKRFPGGMLNKLSFAVRNAKRCLWVKGPLKHDAQK